MNIALKTPVLPVLANAGPKETRINRGMNPGQKPEPEQVYESIASSLRKYGYDDCTSDMIQDVDIAMTKAARDKVLPHFIIGMMASNKLKEAKALGLLM